jgi:hypothetical protein
MPDRREFLKGGAAISALAINGIAIDSAAAVAGMPARSSVYKFVYDDRYRHARELAASVAAQGVAVRALEAGDVTRFWYDELDALWRRRPVAIAGITQFGPMFALEQLGLERGLRAASRVEHRRQPAGDLAGLVAAPSPSPIHYYTPLATQQGYGVPIDGPLYSWSLAPRDVTRAGA